MESLLLTATNRRGLRSEVRLYEHEKQYTIGRDADIALGALELPADNPKRRMYPIAGYITFIDGGWYFRAAKGFRRGKKAVKINGRLTDAGKRDVLLKHGYTISFGEDDEIVVTVQADAYEETLRDRVPALSGLFDQVKVEFEQLNDWIRATFGLPRNANTSLVMSALEDRGLFDAAYEYNLARGLRNIVAHPAPNAGSIRREYVYDAMRAIDSVRRAVSAMNEPASQPAEESARASPGLPGAPTRGVDRWD
jgi:hypothetical protein